MIGIMYQEIHLGRKEGVYIMEYQVCVSGQVCKPDTKSYVKLISFQNKIAI